MTRRAPALPPPGVASDEADRYARHWPVVVDVVCRRIGNREEAEVIAQEALVRALQAARTQPIERFGAYAMRIALNLAIDLRRRSDWRARAPLDPDRLREDPDEGPALADLVRLRTAVDALAPEHRQIVELRYTEGRSFMEIAQALNMSKNGVFARHRRALDALRSFFERQRGGSR